MDVKTVTCAVLITEDCYHNYLCLSLILLTNVGEGASTTNVYIGIMISY